MSSQRTDWVRPTQRVTTSLRSSTLTRIPTAFLPPQPVLRLFLRQPLHRFSSIHLTTVSCRPSMSRDFHHNGQHLEQKFVFRTSPFRQHRLRVMSSEEHPSLSEQSELQDTHVCFTDADISKASFERRILNKTRPTPGSRSKKTAPISSMASKLNFRSHSALIDALEHLDNDTDPLLQAGGAPLVLFRGDPNARLMIIGDFPSEDDDASRRAFSGNAGRLLDSIFGHGGFNLNTQVYITNLVKRRPPGGRKPNRREILFFTHFMHEEIRLVDPTVIVLAGVITARSFLGSQATMRTVRGKWFHKTVDKSDDIKRWIMPIFHPAYLLRKQSMKKEMMDDMDAIRERYMTIFPRDLRIDKVSSTL